MRLQIKRINEEKVKLNKAKEKGEMKGELLITPELLSGTSQTGISGVISKIYDGSIIQRLLGRATSPIRRTAINNYREKVIQDYLEYIIILSHFILSLKIEQEVICHLY